MKYILLFLIISIYGCTTSSKLTQSPKTQNQEISLKEEINNSIIDGFYDGDTNNISTHIYLLK